MLITGIVCVLAALSLLIYNKVVSDNAAKFAEEAVDELRKLSYPEEDGGENKPDDKGKTSDDASNKVTDDPMDTLTVKEYEFIGYLSIPALRLNLPVMAEWSYENLNVSPCRYSGLPETDDFVIAAHNYSSHFGFIDSLNEGDTVSFTDVHAKQINYQVELIDTLSPTDVKDMTSGEYDLTLFTCTYSGQARVTVRLNRIK